MEVIQLTQNPLLNHLVIERLISYLGFQELKSARRVCKLWNSLVTPVLREKTNVKLKTQSLSKFLSSTPIFSIYNNFVLDSWEISTNLKLCYDFFQKYGNKVKEINFNQCIFPNHKVFHEILSFLPHLETVVFGGSYVVDLKDENCGPVVLRTKTQFLTVKALEITFGLQNLCLASWKSLFQYFPNISVLNAQCRTPNSLTEMLQAIRESNLKLTDFSSFLTEFREIDLNLLIQSNFQFRSLDINLSSTVSAHELLLLLKSSKNSMEVLKLFHGFRPRFPTGFPYEITMSNLKTLELVGDMIDSFEFLKFVPKLDALVLLQHDDAEDPSPTYLIRSTPNNMKPHLKLKSLSMEYMLTSECISRLGSQIAPNLARLSAHLDDNSVRSVFENLTNLEELSVLGTEVTDEGITGIPMCDLLGEHNNMEAYREFAYIGDCKRLRKFSLYAQQQENVSDYTVLYGLMDNLELTTVDLPYTAISDAGVLSLQSKPNMINVSAKYYIDVLEGSVVLRPAELQQ